MATNFRVGQRVRVVVPIGAVGREFDGVETEISGIAYHDDYGPAYPTRATDKARYRGVRAACLIPLTDPGFDAFMQSVLKPVNLDQPEKVRV